MIVTATASASRVRYVAPSVFIGAAVISALMSPSVSLWTDEAVTVSAASRTLPELWAMIQRIDAVHGLYYAFMSVWVDVFGSSPFVLRLPSALAAGGTAVGVLMLTRQLADERTALWAASIAAVLPRLVWSGIEARPFVFSALAATWMTVLLSTALRRGRWTWTAYGVVAAVGIFVNIYLVLVVAAHAFTVAVSERRHVRRLVGFGLTAAVVALASLPLLLLVRSQQAQLGGSGDRNALSIGRKVLVNQIFLGETPDPEAASIWWTRSWQGAALVAAVLGLALMLAAVVRRSPSGDASKMRVLLFTLPWLIIPTALVATYAVLVAPIYQPRYFTFTAPAAAVLIAFGLRSLARRPIRYAVAALFLVCVSIIFVSQRTAFAKSGSDWSAVAATISESAQSGDAVYFAPRYGGQERVGMTTRRIAESYPYPFRDLDDLTLEETGASTATLDGYSRSLTDSTTSILGHERVWAIFNRATPEDVFEDSDALLRDLGFVGTERWKGPSTVVVEYSRVP